MAGSTGEALAASSSPMLEYRRVKVLLVALWLPLSSAIVVHRRRRQVRDGLLGLDHPLFSMAA